MLLVTAFVAAIPMAVFAASGSGTTTGSGDTMQTNSIATLPADTGALVQLRLRQLMTDLSDHPVFDAAPMPPQAKIDGWESDVDRYRERSTQFRSQCQMSIRSANRDTIMQTADTCLRGDLMEELSFLRQERENIVSLPGLTPVVASGATVNIDALMSAEMTVVNAIDAKLYTQIDQLKDVKQKLTTQYRTPAWLAMLQVRADRNLTWIHYMSEKLHDVLATGSGTALINNSALDAIECLDSAKNMLRGVVSATDLAQAGSGYTAAQNGLTDCRSELWTVAHLKERQLGSSTATGALAGTGK